MKSEYKKKERLQRDKLDGKPSLLSVAQVCEILRNDRMKGNREPSEVEAVWQVGDLNAGGVYFEESEAKEGQTDVRGARLIGSMA